MSEIFSEREPVLSDMVDTEAIGMGELNDPLFLNGAERFVLVSSSRPPATISQSIAKKPKAFVDKDRLAISTQSLALPLVGAKMKLSPRMSGKLPPIPPQHPSQVRRGNNNEEERDSTAIAPIVASVETRGLRKMRSSFPSSVAEESGKLVLSKRTSSSAAAASKKIKSVANKSTGTYRYKVLPGNNSRVVLACLKRRPWWHASFSSSNTNDAEPEDPTAPVPNFIWEMYRNSTRYNPKYLDFYKPILINKIPKNKHLVTKKGLYYSIKTYCEENSLDPLTVIPLTFYLSPGGSSKSRAREKAPKESTDCEQVDDTATFQHFCASHPCGNEDDIRFIMKPASKTNRGFGIKVVQGKTNVLNTVLRGYSAGASGPSEGKTGKIGTSSRKSSGAASAATSEEVALAKAAKRIAQQDGYIVQLYIEQPLLIQQRKFDIRCFVLVTHSNSGSSSSRGVKAYFYPNAYIRTSSKKYSLNNINDREIHLTNDAVQKNSSSYGKYEDGNKLSLEQWQAMLVDEYITTQSPEVAVKNEGLRTIVFSHIMPEIQKLCQLSISAVNEKFSQSDMLNSFEVFGYDFMICDREKDPFHQGEVDVSKRFYPVLIEVNTNPCLEFVTPFLEELLTDVIESSLCIALDSTFPPPSAKQTRTRATEEAIAELESHENKFLQIFPMS